MQDTLYRLSLGSAEDLKHDYLDLVSVRELQDRGLFTRKSRDCFFSDISENPMRVPYGAALLHARYASAFIWGSEILFQDCVKLMAYEIKKLELENRRDYGVTEQEIAGSKEFIKAYNIVRLPKEIAAHNAKAMVEGSKVRRMLVSNLGTIEYLTSLYERMIEELRGPCERFGFG